MSAADDVVRFFHAIDDRAWPAVRAGLTDEVSSDYSALFGGTPERLAADALITRWQGLLPGFDGTQHLLGPLVVEQTGDDATVACNVRAYHHLGRVDVAGRLLLPHPAPARRNVAGGRNRPAPDVRGGRPLADRPGVRPGRGQPSAVLVPP